MDELALFAGAGGGILGGKLLGWSTVCAVEIDPYAREVLLARQRDGALPRFPIWDDVQTFDGRQWRGSVDVVTGGFPCQDISCAGRGDGIEGERSVLWKEMARIIREVGPRYVLVENSPRLTSRGLGTVLGDLAELGYDARWGVISAAACGAPHIRDRIWILANARCESGDIRRSGGHGLHHLPEKRRDGSETKWGKDRKLATLAPGIHPRVAEKWWRAQRRVDRSVDGMAHRMDRLRAAGNGQVPSVVAVAWEILRENSIYS